MHYVGWSAVALEGPKALVEGGRHITYFLNRQDRDL
jgi:hypothetical protein